MSHENNDELEEALDTEDSEPEFLDEDVQEEVTFDNDEAPADEEGANEEIGVDEEIQPDDDGNTPMADAPERDDSTRKFVHKGAVYSVAISPVTPLLIASGGGDDKAKIWNLSSTSPSPVVILEGHTDSVNKVTFSHDGSLLATGGLDAVVKIWDTKGEVGKLLHSFDGPSESVECITWHSKGPVLFAGGGDGIGWMWNAAQGKVMNVFSGHSDSITQAQFTPDGKNVITASNDGTLRFWDPKTAQTVKVIEGGKNAVQFHTQSIVSLSINQSTSSGNVIGITGSVDGSAVISNFTSGIVMASYREHTASVECTAFLHGLPCGVTGSLDKTAKVWDLNTMQTRTSLSHDGGVVKVLCLPSRQNLIFSASLDSFLRVWDARSGALVHKMEGHTNQLLDFEVVPLDTGRLQIVSGSEDQSVRVWELSL